MKRRNDFVTNSSSSSFIINKGGLSENQIKAIRNHGKLAGKLNLDIYDGEEWSIDENDYCITGYTWLDNFDMREFLEVIGITDGVLWGDSPFSLYDSDEEAERGDAIKKWERLLAELED